MEYIIEELIQEFEEALTLNEKARATVQKYGTALRRLAEWLGGEALTKSKLILKVQRRAFVEENRELTEEEYKRLLEEAQRQGDERLYLLIMTLGSTGIRISELPYVTVEAVAAGRAEIHMKGKSRIVLLPKDLRRRLRDYAGSRGIDEGVIFRTRSGRPMDRSNIGHQMKRLCEAVGVDRDKVFPHNLRHLFARCFYAVEKNLAHLADVLGHSRIETTRIYVAVSAASHERILEQMRLVL